MTTKVLVAYASKHDSTAEIADAIASVLADRGFDVDVQIVATVERPAQYDAFVLGSAVYAGQPLSEWDDFIRDNADLLRGRPVWLFSTGPIGMPPFPREEAPFMAEVAGQIGARGHRVFGGKLETKNLNLAERAVFCLVRAKAGDYRDWSQVIQWADSIGAEVLKDSSLVLASRSIPGPGIGKA